jgi:hypothetical protein
VVDLPPEKYGLPAEEEPPARLDNFEFSFFLLWSDSLSSPSRARQFQ